MACNGCEILPRPPAGAGILYIAAPLGHTHKTLLSIAAALGVETLAPHPGLIGFPIAREGLGGVVSELAQRLSQPEQDGSRVIFIPEGGEFGLGSLLETQPLSTLVVQLESRWLADLIEKDELTDHFQPIVSAGAPQQVYAYECLVRGRAGDGGLIYPDRLFEVARSAGMLFHLDRAARTTAIRESDAHGIREPIFINFNPTSIYDPAFCLRTTIAAAERSGRPSSHFVFEVVESDSMSDVQHLLRILQRYREAGFRVALDDLGAGYGSLNLLAQLRPDFVKFDRELVRNVHQDPYKASVLSKLIDMAIELDVRTVAEGIETREEWEWVRERGVDFVQGYLFARPASPPPLPAPQG